MLHKVQQEMTCFMACIAEEETTEGEKKSLSITIRRIVNMFHQSDSCTVACMGSDEKQGGKRMCFVTFFLALRNRFSCTCGGDD